MSGSSGLSAMIRAGAVLENEFESIEVIAIGRSATAPVDDYTMEVGGRFLFYTVALCGPQIHLSAQPMDTGAAPDLLLRAADNENGWRTVAGVIGALERHEIKSLRRPIEAGTGEFGWVIA
jgi:hypothetical protein